MQNSRAERNYVSDGIRKIDLYSIFEDVGKHWLSILLLTAAVWMFAFVFLSGRQQATYSSSATVAVSNVNFASNVETYDMLGYASDVAGKFKNSISSKELKDAVAADLGLEAFEGTCTSRILGTSNLVQIVVKSGSPYDSYMEVKSLLENYKALEKSLNSGAQITIVEQPVIQETPEISSADLKPAVLVALGAFVLIVGILIIMSVRRGLRTINNGRDVVEKIGTEFLGPIYRNKKHSVRNAPLITDPSASEMYTEGFHKLALRISRKMKDNGQKVLLVTSVLNREGKSAAAANIAVALAQLGHKVVLADMDFSNPPLQNKIDVQESGLQDRLAFLEKGSLKDPDEVGDIIESLRDEADFVIIGAAPVGLSPDAEGLAAMADTSLLIIRRHYADVDYVTKAVNTLGGKECVLGCAVSDVLKYNKAVSFTECNKMKDDTERKSLLEFWEQDELEVDIFALLRDFVKEVRRYIVVILAVILVLGGAGYLTAREDGTTSSTAYTTFAVEPTESVRYKFLNQKNICFGLIGKMYPSIMKSDAVSNAVRRDLDIAPAEEIPAKVVATNVQNTNLVRLTVSSDDPEITAAVMKATLRNSETIAERAVGSLTISVMNETEPAMSVVEGKSGKSGAIRGLLAGLVLCMIALILKLILRGTIISENELTWLLGKDCVGDVPWIDEKDASLLIDSKTAKPAFTEGVRKARYRIEREKQQAGTKVYMVTGAVKGEGNTTIAVNLAISLAANQHKVLLIDANLRDPAVLKALGMQQKEKGLSDLLTGGANRDEVLTAYPGRENLTILPGGKKVKHPLQLWSDGKVRQAIRDLYADYDLVIIDAPQSAVVSDNLLLSELTDACLYVVRKNHAHINEICEGVEVFEESDCRFLGCVLRG